MKKTVLCLLAALALCLAAGALADAGETVTFTAEQGGRITVHKDAEEIDLGKVVLSRQGNDFNNLIAFINQLPNLKKLDMFNTEVYENQVEMLAAACPQVEFGWTMLIPCTNPLHPERTPHRIRTDQTAFSTLHNNQCSEHTSWDFQILRFCKDLKALDIGHNAVTDLSFLYDLPHLKVLILGRNSVSDITPLGSLTELEYLELFSNKVTDITPLGNCVNLVDLNITHNYIKDFSPLKNCTHLRRLFLYKASSGFGSADVPSSDIAMLKSALPGCKVENYSSGAGEAWRAHKRYTNTITKMFSVNPIGTEYIPFDSLD